VWCLLLSSCPGFAQSEEAAPIERLLDAYYECDQEAAEKVIKSPLFKYMENDVSYVSAVCLLLLLAATNTPK